MNSLKRKGVGAGEAGLEQLLRALPHRVSLQISELLEMKESRIPIDGPRLQWRLAERDKPEFGGVYVFWWKSDARQLFAAIQNPNLHFLGPGGRQLHWKLTLAHFFTAPNGYVPLYVGKTSSSIATRVGQHLMLGSERTVAKEHCNRISARKTTSNQLRDRLDRLFPRTDTRVLIRERISLSYVPIKEHELFHDRFHLEDLAIGLLRPTFNVDSER